MLVSPPDSTFIVAISVANVYNAHRMPNPVVWQDARVQPKEHREPGSQACLLRFDTTSSSVI